MLWHTRPPICVHNESVALHCQMHCTHCDTTPKKHTVYGDQTTCPRSCGPFVVRLPYIRPGWPHHRGPCMDTDVAKITLRCQELDWFLLQLLSCERLSRNIDSSGVRKLSQQHLSAPLTLPVSSVEMRFNSSHRVADSSWVCSARKRAEPLHVKLGLEYGSGALLCMRLRVPSTIACDEWHEWHDL